jgi:hypothetical protein
MKTYYIEAHTKPDDMDISYQVGYLAKGKNLIEALESFKDHYKQEFGAPVACEITRIIWFHEGGTEL